MIIAHTYANVVMTVHTVFTDLVLGHRTDLYSVRLNILQVLQVIIIIRKMSCILTVRVLGCKET